MSNIETHSELKLYIERARKVLQHEQRTNHQDQAIKPGGLELFVVRWADETSAAWRNASLDISPIHHFTEHLEGYRKMDPMQRAASIRAALTVLREMEGGNQPATSASKPASLSAPVPDVAHNGSGISGKNAVGNADAIRPLRPQAQPPNRDVEADVIHRSLPPTATHDTQVTLAPQKQANAEIPHETIKTPPKKAESKTTPTTRTAQNTVHLEAGMSAGHAVLTMLTADITAVPGVGPSVATKLRGLGIKTIRDLLFYFPREHRDYSKLTKIASIPMNEVTTTKGIIWEVEMSHMGGKRSRTIATISDETGKIRVTWFNQPYLSKQLNAAKGSYLVVTGVKQRFGNKIEFTVRSH